MNRKRIFDGTGFAEKPGGMHPAAIVLLVLYGIVVLFLLASSSGKGRIALPGPLLIYFLFKGSKKKKDVSVHMDQDAEGNFYFGYFTNGGGPADEYPVTGCSYWYHPETKRDRPPYHLVFKIESGEKIIYLKEKQNG